MNNENVIFKKSEMEEIVDSCSKTILSRFFSSKSSKTLEKSLKRKNQNKRKKTKQVNQPIVQRKCSPNIAHHNTSIEDLFVYEYELSSITHSKCEMVA
jgi:hypothetical protein